MGKRPATIQGEAEEGENCLASGCILTLHKRCKCYCNGTHRAIVCHAYRDRQLNKDLHHPYHFVHWQYDLAKSLAGALVQHTWKKSSLCRAQLSAHTFI